MKLFLILFLFSTLVNGVLLRWIMWISKDLKFFRADSAKWYNVACSLRNERNEEILKNKPMATISAEIVQRIDDLERENATLRTDNETGCALIGKQVGTINTLRDNIQKLIAENRFLLKQTGLKHGKK